MGGACQRTGDRAQFGDHGGADFARQAGLVEVSEEQAAQAAGRDFAGEIGVIDLAADAIAQVLRGGLELALSSREWRPGPLFRTRGAG